MSRGGLTIKTLLETPSLQLGLIAGEGGLDRTVSWTHVSELEDPAPWLDGGELLVTNGLGLSSSDEQQRQLVQRLHERHVAGLAIGVRGPTLQATMLETADQLGFPLLHVPREVPFLSIARMVADANQNKAHQRLVTHVRIFDTLRPNGQRQSSAEIFERLEEISGYDLYLISTVGAPLIGSLRCPPDDVMDKLGGPGCVPDLGNPAIPGGYVVPIPLEQREGAFLVAMEREQAESAGLGAVRHMATIAALELSKLYYERESERRRGAETLAKLFAGRLEVANAEVALTDIGFDEGAALAVAAFRRDDAADLPDEEIHHRLCDMNTPHMLLADGDLFALLPDTPQLLDVLGMTITNLPLRAGVSGPHHGVQSWSVARKEAIWALERGTKAGDAATKIHRFAAEDSVGHWLPTDIGTLESLVDKILAPIIDYDETHNSELLHSLQVFFEHDRRVKTAAADLYVHKHTLAYRLNRIEEITGRDMSRMEDIAQLWLALQALTIVGSRTAGEPS